MMDSVIQYTLLLLLSICFNVNAAPLNQDENNQRIARDAVRGLEAYAEYKAGNYPEAKAIWEELAARGNTTAMINLANLFQLGKGVTEDDLRALDYVRRAADLGDRRAQYELGIAYEKGHLVERNINSASHWLKKAAEGGDVDGQFAWAIMLSTAKGMGIDKVSKAEMQEAVVWLKKAKSQGHPDAEQYIELLTNKIAK